MRVLDGTQNLEEGARARRGARRARRGRRRLRPAAWLALWLAPACAKGTPALALPRLDDAAGVDKLVLERVHASLSAFEAGDAAAALELGLVYEANEIDALAVRAYELCLELPLPAAEVQFHRGRALASMGRAEEAAEAFAASLALDESYVPAHWRSGLVLLDAGRVDEARARFERAIEIEPANVAARLGLARVLLVRDDPAGAIRALQPAVERQPDERFAHGLLARAYQALGDDGRAEAELALEREAGHVSMADPLTAEMRKRATGIVPAVRKANDALAAGKREEALAILEPVYAKDPEKLAIVQMYGKVLLDNGQVERALEVARKGAELHPDDYKLELLMGALLMKQEMLRPALEHLTRSRELNPAYGPTHAALGEVLNELGRITEAEQELELATRSDEIELRTFVVLGQLQLRQTAFERAIVTFERACERFPQAAGAWVFLAEAQAQGGKDEAARASLDKAVALNATHPRIESVRRLLADSGGAR